MRQENPIVHIVDDDEAVRDSLRFLLECNDIEACDYCSADEFLQAAPVNLSCLVLDLHMPGTSGLELLKRLRARGLAIPIVVMSGRSDPALDVEVRAAGASAMLSKPFDDQALLAFIKRALAMG
jgi:two-component system response regulator FixJ